MSITTYNLDDLEAQVLAPATALGGALPLQPGLHLVFSQAGFRTS